LLHVTDGRLLLFRKEPAETLFEVPLEQVRAVASKTVPHAYGKGSREVLFLWHGDDEIARLYGADTAQLQHAIAEQMAARGLSLEEPPEAPIADELLLATLAGEEVIADSEMWYHVPACGILGPTWQKGRLYLTANKLFWRYGFNDQVMFEVAAEDIAAAKYDIRDLGGILRHKPVLVVSYNGSGPAGTALFSAHPGDQLPEWEALVNRVAHAQGVPAQAEPGEETCPQCGRSAPMEKLLDDGCTHCGWQSARRRRAAAPLPAASRSGARR